MPSTPPEGPEDDRVNVGEPCCQSLLENMERSSRSRNLDANLHQSAPQLTRLCISVVVVPGLLIASIILYLLGSRYEHLAEIAEFMLNATLIVSKLNHV